MNMTDPLAHRKATARLRVFKPDGTPAANLNISVKQTAHRFLFGCGAFDTVRQTNIHDEKEQAFLEQRMEKWLALFNYGTLPFYWGRYEPEEG
ncbi:MAG: 1,4-beta-xylanase, partial [Clostridia bacterium]|nr:1,4-beta-xylanase [Clostridia bacterium]